MSPLEKLTWLVVGIALVQALITFATIAATYEISRRMLNRTDRLASHAGQRFYRPAGPDGPQKGADEFLGPEQGGTFGTDGSNGTSGSEP